MGVALVGFEHRRDVTAELEEELTRAPLEVSGEIPRWLSGSLVRNGPVNFTVKGARNGHWFDGLAMLHLFSFEGGHVTYSNRFLRTTPFSDVFEKGQFYEGFAADPCRSRFRRYLTKLFPPRGPTLQNANVNVAKLADQYVALTEVPLPVRFDIETLETLGVLNFEDELSKGKCWESAHPHDDPHLKETLNYLIEYGRRSHYLLYRIAKGEAERQVIARIQVAEPAYMHSFAVTENYVILTEFPFVVKPVDLITKGKAFIKNFEWKPERGTQFTVVERATGNLIGRYPAEPFFAFHHANAFERGGELVVDIVCYDDPSIVADIDEEVMTRVDRFTLSLAERSLNRETLMSGQIEFPRIREEYDGRPYRYLYLTETGDSNAPPLYKLNTETKEVVHWSEEGCHPGEPIFVPSPESQLEDEGVVLSIVIDQIHHSSFLLVLEASSFKELGRARVSHLIPAGLHGRYFQRPKV